ncbi:MAG: DNA repair protein RecO [Cellvibrionaceae bacterium]|nr:DNA repair protein RecO [Cellvibrionaceae bacterium]
MRIELQPAYVLHSRPFKDTSLILDCLTHDYGRVAVLAKGARSAKSRQRQLCQPFVPLWLSWQGKSSLKTLTQLEASAPTLMLQGNFLFSGFYLNELLVRLLPEQDPHSNTYLRYQDCLMQLSEGGDLEPVLRQFEFGFLEDLGYQVDFGHDAAGTPLIPDGFYSWREDHGWERRAEHSSGFTGAALRAMGVGDWASMDTRRQAKRLARMMLQPLLGSKPLQSRLLFT